MRQIFAGGRVHKEPARPHPVTLKVPKDRVKYQLLLSGLIDVLHVVR
jgi:hypothetical protein